MSLCPETAQAASQPYPPRRTPRKLNVEEVVMSGNPSGAARKQHRREFLKAGGLDR
jgi:hypothetical protein